MYSRCRRFNFAPEFSLCGTWRDTGGVFLCSQDCFSTTHSLFKIVALHFFSSVTKCRFVLYSVLGVQVLVHCDTDTDTDTDTVQVVVHTVD